MSGYTFEGISWKWHPRSTDQEHNGSVYSEPIPGHAYAIAMQPRYVTDEVWAIHAPLIAAAPDLLVGARLALSEAESWVHDQLDGTSALDGALARLDPVRAAIAKAEGRAP